MLLAFLSNQPSVTYRNRSITALQYAIARYMRRPCLFVWPFVCHTSEFYQTG